MSDETTHTRRSFLNTTVAAAAVAGAASAGATEPASLPQEATRGSEKAIHEHGPMIFSSKDVDEIRRIVSSKNAKLLSWCQFGQPAVDGVCGTFEVPQLDSAGSLIIDLLRLHPRFRLGVDVFPYGIPVLDRVFVDFRGGVQRGVGR